MASVVLYHSVLGLRPVEMSIAQTLRSAGHEVWTPDLYLGLTASTVEQGIELKDKIGWDRLCDRAAEALIGLPETTVLAGISMGCGIVASVWPHRRQTSGILLLHALADFPGGTDHQGLPLQLHIGEKDDFWPKEKIFRWSDEAAQANITAELFLYANARHFYTDSSLPDHEPSATRKTLERILQFLDRV